jgi:hypothetical protein
MFFMCRPAFTNEHVVHQHQVLYVFPLHRMNVCTPLNSFYVKEKIMMSVDSFKKFSHELTKDIELGE